MKSFTQTIHIIAVALLIGWGVSAVSAWTAPTVNPPATGQVRSPDNDTAQGVAGSINLTSFDQVKKGGIILDGDTDTKWVSPLSFFKKVLLPGADTSVYIGGSGTADPTFLSQFPGTRAVPLTINMTGRPVNAIKYLTNVSCPQPTKLITDSSAYQFWNEAAGENADVLAKGIRLSGGNPAPGKILISVDNNGRAVWATPKLAANGRDIVFDTTVSPVGSCTPPVDTYAWSTGVWSCVSPSNPSWKNADYPNGTIGQSCASWLAQNAPRQTRTVECKNQNGVTVSDSFCTTPKPTSVGTTACASPENRVLWNSSTVTNSIYSGNCVYAKPGAVGIAACVQQTPTAQYVMNPQTPTVNGVTNPSLSEYLPTAHCVTSGTTGGVYYGPPGSSTSPENNGITFWGIDARLQLFK